MVTLFDFQNEELEAAGWSEVQLPGGGFLFGEEAKEFEGAIG